MLSTAVRASRGRLLQAYDAGAVIGGVCHGPLGLLAAKRGNGHPLVNGRALTAVTKIIVSP